VPSNAERIVRRVNGCVTALMDISTAIQRL
jgi:hypothetical protein